MQAWRLRACVHFRGLEKRAEQSEMPKGGRCAATKALAAQQLAHGTCCSPMVIWTTVSCQRSGSCDCGAALTVVVRARAHACNTRRQCGYSREKGKGRWTQCCQPKTSALQPNEQRQTTKSVHLLDLRRRGAQEPHARCLDSSNA